MFKLIELENIVNSHNIKSMSKRLTSGFCYVHFKRSILEKQIYNFVGYCISAKNRGISSTFIVRNVLKSNPVEYTFNKHSPLISSYFSRKELQFTKKSKLFFLRKKPTPWSKIKFIYIK